jgi:hypothetical protein
LGSFCENAEVAPSFGLLFPTLKVMFFFFILTQNGLGYSLGDFFHLTHLVALASTNVA